jgi:deoxyribonuclease-1
MKLVLPVLLASTLVLPAFAANQTIQSFSQAKKKLQSQVYNNHRETVYCAAKFNTKKQVTAPVGLTTTKYVKRAKKIE